MIPPTSIDGTDITGATIDGTDVTEITVDGDTVFTGVPDSGVFRLTFDSVDTQTGTAIDVWNDFDGTINGATTGVTGELGEAYDFDGVDDYVDIPNDPALVLGDGSTDSSFSVSAWINPDTASKFRIISKADSSSEATREYLFTTTGGNVLALALYDDGSLVSDQLQRFGQTDFSTLTGTYTNVIATYDGSGSASGVSLYVNGTEESYSTTSVGSDYTAMRDMGGSVDVGRLADPGDLSYADGKIDDVRLYSKELTSTEVSNLYNTGSI